MSTPTDHSTPGEPPQEPPASPEASGRSQAPSRGHYGLMGVGIAFAVGLVGYTLTHRPEQHGTTVTKAVPDAAGKTLGFNDRTMVDAEAAPSQPPAWWIDVDEPQKLRTLITENTWLQETLKTPLGEGFSGGWSALLNSTADDVGLSSLSRGLVRDVLLDMLLAQPLRVVTFATVDTPALVLVAPNEAVKAAFATLDAAVVRGGYKYAGCIDDTTVPAFEVHRLRIADREFFAAHVRDRLVLAKRAAPVREAVCAKTAAIAPAALPNDVDVRLAFDAKVMGRETQILTAMLGAASVTLDAAIVGTRLVPVGIAGPLTHPNHLGDATANAAAQARTLKLVPADMPVVLALHLALPKVLDTQSLLAFWSTADADKAPELVTRHVVVAWQPHGNGKDKSDIAVLWSAPEDEAALSDILAGNNRMTHQTACEVLVFASNDEMMRRLKDTCAQKSPAVAFAGGSTQAAVTQPHTVALLIDAGAAMARVMDEAYAQERQQSGSNKATFAAQPPELEAAKTSLRALPRTVWLGDKGDRVLRASGAAL